MTAPAPTPSRPGWSLRRKALTTGAVGILAIGIYLGTLFDGFGLGSGFGLGGSAPGGASGDGGGAPPDTSGLSADLGPSATIHAKNAADPATATGPLAVFITADGYELPGDSAENLAEAATLPAPLSEHFVPAALDDVVARAKQTVGNAGGIRVLIYRHKSSTVGLHGTLVHALQDAGLPSGALHVVTGFFD